MIRTVKAARVLVNVGVIVLLVSALVGLVGHVPALLYPGAVGFFSVFVGLMVLTAIRIRSISQAKSARATKPD
jgi:hypothetical protein